MTDNIIGNIADPIICTAGAAFEPTIAKASSEVDQQLTTNNVSEIVEYEANKTTTADVIFNTDNEIDFLTTGKYQILFNCHVKMNLATAQVQWYLFYEIDTGGGYANIANFTSNRTFNSADFDETKPVTMQPLYLTVTAVNTTLRLRHQTTNVSRQVRLEHAAVSANTPVIVPSTNLLIIKLGEL